MALGINTETSANGGGDITPIVKYNAKAGRIFRIDRIDGKNNEIEISREFKAVVDLENVEVGYINFDTGSAPDFSVVRLGSGEARKSSDKHKPGVRMMLKLHKDCGGDVREMAGTAKAFLKGVDALHDAYLEGAKLPDNAGKLPVIIMSGITSVTTGEGDKKTTNYIPTFDIKAWVPRPADLVYSPKSPSAASQSNGSGNAPPATGGSRAAPPPQEPAPAASSDDDFG